MKKSLKDWWQIEVEEEIEMTSGKELLKFLNFIAQYIIINKVVCVDLDGAIAPHFIRMGEPMILSFYRLQKLLPSVVQFDFGFFYLFESKNNAYELNTKICNIAPCHNFFHKTVIDSDLSTMVAVFDDMSFIVYTKNKK